MDGQAGEPAHRQSWAVVIAGRLDALRRLNERVRPGVALAFCACLAGLYLLRRLSGVDLPTLTVGRVSIELALPRLHGALIGAALLFGLVLIALAWWLPRGHGAAVWTPLALAGFAAPLLAADPFVAACALLSTAVSVAPALACGDDDGGATLFLGVASVGVVCLVLGLIIAGSAGAAAAQANVSFAHLLIVAGFSLLFGIVPGLFWQEGVSAQGHALGAALVTGLLPAAAYAVALRLLDQGAGWLADGANAQAMAQAGVIVAIVAAALALLQQDIRRLVGFLFVADLGYMLVTWGRGAPELVMSQLLGRALAALIVFPCLGLLAGGSKKEAKPALVLLLAYGAWMTLGGPLTPAFPARWPVLQAILAGNQPWAALLAVALGLSGLAYLAFIVRVVRSPSGEAQRPALRLALLILTALVAISLALWRSPL